jgi:dihydroorotate dehydrogenase electron transfer subunit
VNEEDCLLSLKRTIESREKRMSGIVQQLCKVQSCDEVAAKIFFLRFASSEIAASAQPGQFVNVLAAETGEGPLLRRPFSIARIDDDIVGLLFHTVGTGTNLLSRKQPGETIDVLGPLGQPFRVDADYDTALIVAGGIGVAPFPFLTEDLLGRRKHIETFVGYRNTGQIFTSHLQNIHIATEDGSKGFHGTVVQLFEPFMNQTDLGKAKIFACGPTAMLKALTELAERKNICCEVSLEGHMACGVGLCQGCPVERTGDGAKYALVCKDGPIFLTTDIIL